MLLLDSGGALLSAFLLGVILVSLQEYFGMPAPVLGRLSLVACAFAAYSLISFFLKKSWATSLRVIAVANLLYCGLTISLMLIYREDLSAWGWAYFVAEVAVIAALAGMEWQVAAKESRGGE